MCLRLLRRRSPQRNIRGKDNGEGHRLVLLAANLRSQCRVSEDATCRHPKFPLVESVCHTLRNGKGSLFETVRCVDGAFEHGRR